MWRWISLTLVNFTYMMKFTYYGEFHTAWWISHKWWISHNVNFTYCGEFHIMGWISHTMVTFTYCGEFLEPGDSHGDISTVAHWISHVIMGLLETHCPTGDWFWSKIQVMAWSHYRCHVQQKQKWNFVSPVTPRNSPLATVMLQNRIKIRENDYHSLTQKRYCTMLKRYGNPRNIT